jgi:hypothetical protein
MLHADQTATTARIIDKPCRLVVERFEGQQPLAEVSLENDDGQRCEPFRCRSERAVEEVVGKLIDIYPDIDIVR